MISRDEWLSALAACEPESDKDALTVSELMALMGWTRAQARSRIPKMVVAGKVVQTQKHIRGTRVTAYCLVK